jgi:hypothetical protein
MIFGCDGVDVNVFVNGEKISHRTLRGPHRRHAGDHPGTKGWSSWCVPLGQRGQRVVRQRYSTVRGGRGPTLSIRIVRKVVEIAAAAKTREREASTRARTTFFVVVNAALS